MLPRPSTSTLFPYTTLFRSECVPVGGLFETHLTVSDLDRSVAFYRKVVGLPLALELPDRGAAFFWIGGPGEAMLGLRSEEHTSELQSRLHLVCRLLLEKKKG